MNQLLPFLAKNPAYPKFNMLVLSHSSMTTFNSCQRKLEFRQLYGVPYDREEEFAASCGSALHRGYGTWLMTEDYNQAVVSFGVAYPYDLEFLKAGNASRSMEACYATLDALISSGHLTQYQVAKINTPKHGVQYGVEIPFAFRIVNAPLPVPVYFVGLIDCVLYDHSNDRFIVTDLKTTRQWLDDPSAKFQYDQQTLPYAIVLEHMLDRVIETIEVAYLYAYIDLREPKIKFLEYERTLDDVIRWKNGLFRTIDEIAYNYSVNDFPRAPNGDSCIAFNKPCYFHEICSYKDPATLNKVIQGEERTNIFSTGTEPWLVLDLPYEAREARVYP